VAELGKLLYFLKKTMKIKYTKKNPALIAGLLPARFFML
jgi:hypothetical protein